MKTQPPCQFTLTQKSANLHRAGTFKGRLFENRETTEKSGLFRLQDLVFPRYFGAGAQDGYTSAFYRR